MSVDQVETEPHLTIRMALDVSTPSVLPPKFGFSFDFGNVGYHWSGNDRAAAVKKLAAELARLASGHSKSERAQDLGITVDHSFTGECDVYEVFAREDYTENESTIQVHDPLEIIYNPDCLIRDALAVAFPGRLILINTSRDAVVTGLRDLKSFIQYRRSEVEQPEELSRTDWVKKYLPYWNFDPLAAVNAKRDDDLDRGPTDHIPALRGLFALARGDYATVSAGDLTAAVDAGYVHPDVLAAVADEIAYATESDHDREDEGVNVFTAPEPPTSLSVSDLSIDYENACLDFVFEGLPRWERLQVRKPSSYGFEAYVDAYDIKQTLVGAAPDITCAELDEIMRKISNWFEEPAWTDCPTSRGAFAGEVIFTRDRVRLGS